MNKKSEGHKEVSGTLKDKKEKDLSESHVEMDSRLLSALLTVCFDLSSSISFVFLLILMDLHME